MQEKEEVKLPPKFERTQLVFLQLGIGALLVLVGTRLDIIIDIFKPDYLQVLATIRVIICTFGFFCTIIAGGKAWNFYKEFKEYLDSKKKKSE
jgi:hypothetical protein